MGKKNAGEAEAKQARADEEARQGRIRQGTSRINSIFDGGTTTSGQVGAGAYDPTKTYYNADGSVWTPQAGLTETIRTGGGGGGGGRDGDHTRTPVQTKTNSISDAIQFANAQKKGLFSDKTTSTGFDDNFFKGRRDAYQAYANPQLEDQYGDANKQLTFSLARGGLLDSSVRGEKLGDLQKLYDTQKQAVADKALSYETSARNSVEDARGNLISTLNATGDAEGAAKSALARSSALTQPDAYSPLGQLFTDFTNGLGIQAAQERSYAAGGAKPLYNTGLFSNAGRVAVSQ